MHSTAATRASGTARRASDSPAARALARLGLTARGVLYILIGWIAILVAVGHSSHEADQQGALQLLAGQSYGLISLWVLGNGAGPRLKSLARAVIYGFFAYQAFKIISGAGGGSQAAKQEDLTASVMHHSGGRWLVGIAGLVIVVVGVILVLEGIRRKFMKYLQLSQLSPRARKIVEWLGVIGTAARGTVFGLAGVLVIDAAVTYQPSKAGGIDKALLTLRSQPFGEALLIIAALGLIIFGIYGLCEARWRRV
jgi:hypothetical protein